MVEIRFLSQADREIHKIRSEHSKLLTKNFVHGGCLLIPAIVGCFFSGAGGGRTVIFCRLCKHICCKEIIFVGQNSEGQQSSFFSRVIGGSTLSLLFLSWSEWTLCPCYVCSTQCKECLLMNDSVLYQLEKKKKPVPVF